MIKRKFSITTAGIIVIACLFYAINGGIRCNYGLFRGSITDNSGVSYASVSLVLAVAQLSFGIMQPVFGALALKKTNTFVLGLGGAIAATGLVLIPFCHSIGSLMLCLGLMVPIGLAAFSFGIIMGTVTPLLGERRAAVVSGFVSASCGGGSILFAPILRSSLDSNGLWGAILSLCIPAACLIPAALWLSRQRRTVPASTAHPAETSLKELIRSALKNPSYRRLMTAFFLCGFHMAIIETHLYSHFLSYGFSDQLVSYAFSAYGLACVVGGTTSGFLCSRFPMQRVLGCLYASRTIWILGFLLLPKSAFSMYAFIILLGLTGGSVVPPTSGLVSKLYGSARLGTLFGLVFVAHQFGSFFSAWLGGVCLSATGGYALIWCASALFSQVAAFLSFRVKTH